MINNIHKIAFVSDDIEGAVRFYTETLGLTELERFSNEDDEDFVFLKAGDMILELMPQKTMQADVGFHHVSFKVGNVDESAGELKGAGVDIAVEPFDAEGTDIRLSFFNGPDDVLLQLFQRESDPA